MCMKIETEEKIITQYFYVDQIVSLMTSRVYYGNKKTWHSLLKYYVLHCLRLSFVDI